MSIKRQVPSVLERKKKLLPACSELDTEIKGVLLQQELPVANHPIKYDSCTSNTFLTTVF